MRKKIKIDEIVTFLFLSLGMLYSVQGYTAEQNGTVLTEPNWTIQVGIMPINWPVYKGSDELETIAFPYFSVEYKNRYFIHAIDGIGVYVKDTPKYKVGLSLGYVIGREESDSSDLQGLGDIENGAAFNLFGEYRIGLYSFSSKLTQRLSDENDGFTIDLDAAYTHFVNQTTVIKPALITSIANSRYHQSFFGIDETQANASGLSVYKPDAGITSAGVQIDVLRVFANRWNLFAQAKYERLLDDVEKSPIVLDENQYTIALGIAYQFRR